MAFDDLCVLAIIMMQQLIASFVVWKISSLRFNAIVFLQRLLGQREVSAVGPRKTSVMGDGCKDVIVNCSED